jgi:hypothetical protein
MRTGLGTTNQCVKQEAMQMMQSNYEEEGTTSFERCDSSRIIFSRRKEKENT